MKVFKLTLGGIEHVAVAENYEEMYRKRAEIEPVFSFTPVKIEELKVPGYVITAKPTNAGQTEQETTDSESEQTQEPDNAGQEQNPTPYSDFEGWLANVDRDELKAFLRERNIEFKGNAKTEVLIELVRKNA